MSTTQAPATPHGHSTESPCRCHDEKPASCTCCGITCFERPNYFCGHLLTDADLSLEQKYLVEKNKLYHRAIDGYGVACGLKLTCDHHCCGQVLIHEGFAIDDCGHDLVVCETARFDVIGTLEKKGLLVADEPEDDCEPKHRERRCKIKQCFYITICYDETKSNYETPFQSACTSGPKQCLPTRTKEGYRFDVTDKLPPEHSYFAELEKRFKECFEINCDSRLGRYMKEEETHAQLLDMVTGKAKYERWGQDGDPYCKIFCTLRALFLNHLRVKPDQFNCNLHQEVACLVCPSEDCDSQEDYCNEMQEATSKLLYYIQRYQFDCVLGDLIFSCPEPCEAHCLTLGTVEVVDGKLIRVCNTPRRYLWSAANLLQVLTYTVMTKRFPAGEDGRGRHDCCPDYRDFDPDAFLREFKVNECGRYFAAMSFSDACRGLGESVSEAFDAFKTTRHSPKVVAHAQLNKTGDLDQQLQVIAASLGINIKALDDTELSLATPGQAFRSPALFQRGDSLHVYKTAEGTIGTVLHDFITEISPDRSFGERIEGLEKRIEQLEHPPEAEGSKAKGKKNPPPPPSNMEGKIG